MFGDRVQAVLETGTVRLVSLLNVVDVGIEFQVSLVASVEDLLVMLSLFIRTQSREVPENKTGL